jgi:hypothetical protein
LSALKIPVYINLGQSYSEKWKILGLMGPKIASNQVGDVIISAPFARSSDFDFNNERMAGAIVKKFHDDSIFWIADGLWVKQKLSSHQDSHVHDMTGSSFVQGDNLKKKSFINSKKYLFFDNCLGQFFYNDYAEHFAVGAPKASNLRGLVYICHNCFRKYGSRDFDFTIPGDQYGSRFGESIAAVDINGDGYDDLIVGAPLQNSKVG